MGQGCRQSQRSCLGRPAVLLSADSKPGWEAGLGRQESAEAIVLVREHQEGPNVEEDGNLSGSWDRRRRQESSDEDTTGWAKAVKLPGFSQRAESSPASSKERPRMSALVLPCNPFLGEPPDAIKHVRWCERGRLQSRPYSTLRGTAGPGVTGSLSPMLSA